MMQMRATGALGRKPSRAAWWTVAAAATALVLSACAEAARPTALVTQATEATLASPTNILHRKINVSQITGGKDTTALSGAQVATTDFREGVETSLRLSALLADQPTLANYLLDVVIEEVEQPTLQINFEVTTRIFYRLRARSGAIVYEDMVEEAYTAQFSESFVRGERIRIATERAFRQNIQTFMARLVERSRDQPYEFLS